MRKTNVQNTEQRRQQILRAAIACFSRSGLHGTSMAQICVEAGLSPAHPYYYFKNKEALVRAVYVHDWSVATRFLDSLIDAPHGLAIYLDLIRSPNHAMQKELVTGPAFGLEVAAESFRDPELAVILADHRKRFVAKIGEIARAAKKRGEIAEGVSIADVVHAVDAVASARLVSLATHSQDDAEYVRRTAALLKGVLKLPTKLRVVSRTP